MNHRYFQIRGVVEGFYGIFYTFPERNDLIRFIGEQGFNLYIYGPKNDRQHRARWREPYPPRFMQHFAETVAIAEQSGVNFCYAISPGVSMNYASEEDFLKLTSKLTDFFRLGVRSFSLFLDDIDPVLRYPEERERFSSFAEAQADLANRLFSWLKELDPQCSLSLCPTDYHGIPPFSQGLYVLGQLLHPGIDIFYTGPKVCSPTITRADAAAFADIVNRPPLIWDNYPVNDLGMQSEIHLSPIRGRDPELHEVVQGVVVNTMAQAEASKIALATFAEYFRDPVGYNAEMAWLQALRQVAGDDSFLALYTFAENAQYSCLGVGDPAPIEVLAAEIIAGLNRNENRKELEALVELESYLDKVDEACYHLKNLMDNLSLRNNLLQWIEALEHWIEVGRNITSILRQEELENVEERKLRSLREALKSGQNHPKRVAGAALMPLAERVLKVVEERREEASQVNPLDDSLDPELAESGVSPVSLPGIYLG